MWPRLFGEIESRWRDRFGADAIDELRGPLEAIVERVEVELPEYVPVVDGKDGMAAGLSTPEKRVTAIDSGPLTALLTRALLAYTIDFEPGRSCRFRSARTWSESSGWTSSTLATFPSPPACPRRRSAWR